MNHYLLLPIIQAVFSLALAVIVLKGHFRSFVHRLFSIDLMVLASWGIVIFGMRASPNIEYAYAWDRWVIPLAPLMSVLLYHFSVRYTATKINRWLLPSLYFIFLLFIPLANTNLVFSGMQIKSYGYAPILGPVAPFFMLSAYVISIMALVIFIRSYRKEFSAERRNRIAYIIIGIFITFVGGAFDFLPILGLPLYPGAIIGNIIFCLITTMAIIRHKLLDIRIVLRKGVAYVLTSALIAIPFVGVFLLVTFLFEEGRASPWTYLLILIALALTLPQLWQWIQRRVERWFSRDRYDYLKALVTFSRETQSVTDSAKLGPTMVNLLTGALRTSRVYILQPLSPSGDFTIAFSPALYRSNSHIILKMASPLVKWLERSEETLSYDDIDVIPQLQGMSYKERENLEQLRTKLIAGLKTPTGRLSGVLILGPKLSDQPYTIEDKELINTICSQMAIALENARLYAVSQQEVAERKQAEEKQQTILKTALDGFWLADLEGKFVEVNDSYCEMMGYSREQLLKMSISDIEAIETHEETIRHVNRIIEQGYDRFESQHKCKDGKIINVDVSVNYLGGEEGQLFVFVHDITERKRSEEELKQSQEQLRDLSAHIESMREAERTSIAREVHDELGQSLTAIKMELSWLNKRLPEEQEELTKKIREMSRLISTTIQTVKRISTKLRPGVLDDLGLMAAIEWQVQEFQERTRIKCEFSTNGDEINLDRDLATGVFRIFQEALTNVARHANASMVAVGLKVGDGQLVLQIKDDGKGITEKQIAHPKSLGLIGMRERARSLNGSTKIHGTSGKGTTVTVSIPLNRKEGYDDKNTSR